ncbi:MAG: NADH:ubiquinone reductase (Na(+)-transporting) subunit B [Prevotellaceae bacterium]|jgi:Na+-transporting NADH:ubiquinone oxidoreductase subunit B|nr:NADH:ubiquinone reductase (Na(+)-transporting) subunit B [Prevotellaceae bacterium]
MKFLHRFINKIKPSFEKGGKFSKLHSVFEGFETFLFVPNTVTAQGVHIRDCVDLKRIMSVVVFALMPCLLFGMWNTGYQHFRSVGLVQNPADAVQSFWTIFWFGFWKVLPIIVVSYVVGLGVEFTAAQIRGHEINEGFLVSGMLIPLIMPADIPLWMVALATIFAVVIGKEVFGGTGMNIWNPALLARAFIFFSYPSQISGDKVWIAGLTEGTGVIDGFSGATPLAIATGGTGDTAASMTVESLQQQLPSIYDMFMGFIPGSIGETSKLAILLGAIVLLITGVGSWRIMLATVIGALGVGYLCNLFAANPYMALPPYYHLLMGGFAFGAVFMATDPVTASQTNTGKWIYGLLLGMIIVVIRIFNPAYPEGVMLAILLMNTFAPLIDYYVVGANINRRLKRAKAKS